MKIIDLLNKIANGEDMPKKIEYNEHIWEYVEAEKNYHNKNDYSLFGECMDINLVYCLSDEVEIIEEDKKIEKFKNYEISDAIPPSVKCELLRQYFTMLCEKVNEIIDVINEKS